MSKSDSNFKTGVLVAMILVAIASRLLPHPDNFTPMGAIALFGAAHFPKKWMSVVVTFASLWISSLIIDNLIMTGSYDGFQWFSQPWVFLAYGLTILIGWTMLKKVKFSNLLLATLASSAVFFLVTNFGFWLGYVPEKNIATLIASYVAAIPFDRSMLLSNLFYVGVMFGSYELIKRNVPALQVEKAA